MGPSIVSAAVLAIGTGAAALDSFLCAGALFALGIGLPTWKWPLTDRAGRKSEWTLEVVCVAVVVLLFFADQSARQGPREHVAGLRTVTIPAGVKVRIDLWIKSAGITEGRLFRLVSQAGTLGGTEIKDEKAIWRLVVRYAHETELGKLAPHDLRRTCAKLCRKAGGELEQIQLLLGHASVQTTERYRPRTGARPCC